MHNKSIVYSILFAISLLFVSCKKDSSLTIDNVPPKLIMKLSGGGTEHTFETNGTGMSPEGEFHYKENTKYNFTITLYDTSGLGQLRFRITKSGAVNGFELSGTPTVVAVDNPSEHEYSIITERTNPYKSFLMYGSFTTGTELGDSDIEISIIGRDYLPNTTNLFVNGYVYMQPPLGNFGWIRF